MKLLSLKEGSKTKIKLGACCGHPLTFSAWAIGEETAFLQKRAKPQNQNPASEKDKGTQSGTNSGLEQ